MEVSILNDSSTVYILETKLLERHYIAVSGPPVFNIVFQNVFMQKCVNQQPVNLFKF